jgi:uracil-DNA glycosylase family 4
MRSLPLYPRRPLVAVETEEGLDVDKACKRCDMSTDVRTVCMRPVGDPGGLLVVGEFPVRADDQVGRPLAGEAGRLVLPLLKRLWAGPMAVDYAVRCAPGKREVKDKHADACRGYLAQTIAEVQPTRIVALGGWAAHSLMDRTVSPFINRRSYSYLLGGRFGAPIPVFFVLTPNQAMTRGAFVRGWFASDLEWALTSPPPPLPPLDGVVRLVETGDDARAALAAVRAAPWATFDIETCGAPHTDAFRLLCLGVTPAGTDDAWVWNQRSLGDFDARAVLVELLTDPRINKRGSNVKYDEVGVALRLGVDPRGVAGDVRLWRKLLEPEADGKLDKMAELVGMGGMKEEAQAEMRGYVDRCLYALKVEKRLAQQKVEDDARRQAGLAPKNRTKLRPAAVDAQAYFKDLEERDPQLVALIRETCDDGEGGITREDWERWAYALIPDDMLLRYNGRDNVASARLGVKLEAELAAVPPLDSVRRKVVDRAAHAIRRVEQWGVAVDRDALLAFDGYLSLQLEPVRARLAPYDFDPDSTPQVRKLLFETLKLKPLDTTKTGLPTTDGDTLEILAKLHPVAADIDAWRKLSKLRGTYAAGGGKGGMLQHLRPDGRGWRIHPSILLDGARSGRTSCQDPNLQNIPRAADSPEGRMARDIFVAPPGFTLLQLDYSQLELRIAAMLSGDPDMISIFHEGVDFHQRTAEMIAQIAWGMRPEDVGKPQRSQAKAVNFGILYGKTARTLAAEWGVSIDKAQQVMDAILGRFKKLAKWCNDRRRESRETGVSWTWWDGEKARRRPLYRIADPDDYVRSTAENGAVNTPIQGTASEFCIASLADSVEWIEADGLDDLVRLTLPVHDSLLFEVRNDLVHEVAHQARRIMTGHNSDGVPLEVDCEVGPAWGSLVKYDFGKAA